MAEGARLESVYTFIRIEGSNPSFSAKYLKARVIYSRAFLLPNIIVRIGDLSIIV